MRAEAGEQPRVAHAAVLAFAPHARRVVEHDAPGHAAQTLEQPTQRGARAFRVLARRQARDGRVRIRKGEHEVMHATPCAAPPHVRLAEIRLGLALMPRQVQEPPLALETEPALELVHLARHGRQGHVRTMLAHQTLVNARGRVALLRPRFAVLDQPLLDQRHPRVDLRRPRTRHRRLGRQIRRLEVLAYGRLAHMQLAGYRRDRAAFLSHRTDRVDDGHADHCLSGPFNWKK